MRTVGAALTFAVWLVGIPVALALVAGWPVPSTLPTGREILDALSQPDLLTEQNFLKTAAGLVWLMWGLSVAYTAYVLAAVARPRQRRIPVPRLVRRVVTGLVGSISVAATGQAAAIAAPAVTAPAAPELELPNQVAAEPQPSTDPAAGSTPTAQSSPTPYRVVRGDTLWDLAEDRLGDGQRWDDIYDLNKGRRQPDGQALRDPDLIQPGWRLMIPSAPAEDVTPTPTSPKESTEDPRPTPPEPPTPAQAAPTPSAHAEARRDVHVTRTDDEGVELSDGSWIPWTLVGGLATVTAAVWAQRRRRYSGKDAENLPTMPAPALVAIDRVAARDRKQHSDDRRVPADSSATSSMPLSGVSALVGDGGLGVARSALVATLAVASTDHTELRGEVVTDRASLVAMLGPAAGVLGGWARLHVAADVYEAAGILETRLLHRARILESQTSEEPPPPLLFICAAPQQPDRGRLSAILDQGRPLGASALLLGEWSADETITVSSDGTVRGSDGRPPSRLAVLTVRAANEAINALREAQTGETAGAPASVDLVPLVAPRALEAATAAPAIVAVSAADQPAAKARLRVLGSPGIDDITEPGRPLRAKALEVAVLLACHPDGLTTRDIGEHVEPDAKLKQADERVHTNVSNLRQVFGRAAGKRSDAYVVRTSGRYRLDRVSVDVDLWELRDLLRNAATANHGKRRRLLEAACELYTEPLAASSLYDWIQPHREAVRRWGTEAHLQLGELLLAEDPAAASALLDKAIKLDRFNEALYRLAMRARHALNDTDSVDTLLRALARALAEIDAKPAQEITQLARQLQAR
ncbi:LysM domain-containing protein [Asanoa hainanensis]|uniref:LysM domain-containing protein n=1 Tax=Asanoa hainanensis TaxID=560556 RepID=A0A239J0J9_9ACTN|nr:LysM peptidoglycan-binding domain-containing protein [Asanoa hainanensis]SNS98988.1 LysM domain-containing protein [Asanoa hainanensis]